MLKKSFFATLFVGSVFSLNPAFAEGMDIAVGKGLHLKQVDGSWVQLEHFVPKTKKTDICVASARDQSLVLRIAQSDMQIRTYDQKWHLTPEDKNSVDMRLGNGYKAHYDLKYLDKRGFYTDVSFSQMSVLLKALETGQAGSITFADTTAHHTKKVKKINPAKAEKVFFAFRNCVRAHHFAPLEAPLPLKQETKDSEEPVVFPKQVTN
ncbi:hypothetical protein FAI41_02820 [Acetobacteraceae bacterium]|nr:hypothetical protein FAI41_02820 [Acetobacteraceae bacterium]